MAYIGKQPVVGNFQKCDAITVVNGQAAYTLNVGGSAVSPENANHMLVSLNGVLQAPGDSFTVSGSTLTFASNLATGDVIDFVIILGDVLDLGTPSDNSISTAKLVANSVTAAKFNADVISGQTELASEPADTDEFLVSDAGTLKRIDYSLIKGSGKLLQYKISTDETHRTQSGNFNSELSNTMGNTITPTKVGSRIIAFTGTIRWYTYGAGTLSLKRDGTIVSSASHSQSGYPTADEIETCLFDEYTTTGTSQIAYTINLQDTGSSSGSGSLSFHEKKGILHLIEVDA